MCKRKLQAGMHTDEIHQETKCEVNKKETKTDQQSPWTKHKDLQVTFFSRDSRGSGIFGRG